MTIAIDASAVEAMIPNAGTPAFDMRLNRSGNSPSLAAARGISAQISVQPFRQPRPEMITMTAITLPAQVRPNIKFTASENGAVEVESVLPGTIPNTANSESTYTTAQAIVPSTVERGTLRSGSLTLAAATAAVSMPR